ncbi:putative bifunctional diguanylate cyclase/phosphodiesterase [Pseudorhodoferax sp.]|uniref:putative bifunctional diguanylate cyclase/phosphodiesterase n=1 Tax=Pseudorhodoferax sp. TaxID=1993553 RepID=UPI002DD683C5|nr:bifunctional diguanylate cyclase/phosphodiesterase [Pseudorhodoferax sp.]
METSDGSLRLYRALAAFKRLNYRVKILLMAFIGIHVPLIALALWYAFRASGDWHLLLETLIVTLVATLLGTLATLLVLGHLLKPVVMTSRALRAFREGRPHPALPIGYTDEVGTLMADAQQTLRELDAAMHRLSYMDEASGLPNRKHFEQQVTQRIASGHKVVVAALQFDNLPRISDTLDVRHADEAMQQMAARLRAHAEFGDQLSRIGPRVFGCLVGTGEGVALRVRAGLAACAAECAIGEVVIHPVLQAGLAAHPVDGASAAALVDAAISAAGRASALAPVALHSRQARESAQQRLQLEHELRRALQREEFVLHFQPVVDVQAGRTVGAEALLRWNHPERGMVFPQAFIGAAEASGLIEPLGMWVLRQACAQLQEWNAGGLPGLHLAINVSARQFQNPALNQWIIDTIAQYRIAPGQLEIELTETAAMADHGHSRRVFTSLREAGIRIAIDDFGTGYASMSVLRTLPFDKLKIDREFVSGVQGLRQSQAICSALIELAKGLDLQVVAEGAETELEVRELAARGCRLFQGYHFSRPVPAAAFLHAMGSPLAAGAVADLAAPARGEPPHLPGPLH